MNVIGQGKFFSKLQKYQICDAETSHIGRVGDLLLRKEDMSVYALISFDNTLKEKLESMHILDDRDEIIPLHHIDTDKLLPNQIYTTIAKHKLRTTHTDWDVPNDYYKFSDLCNLSVIDSNNNTIGQVTDIIYHENGGYCIVVNSATYIQQVLERLHLRHYHELIVPQEYIQKIDHHNITLSIDREAIEKIDALPILTILSKNRQSFKEKPSKPQNRYHYYVLQTPISLTKKRLNEKGEKLARA